MEPYLEDLKFDDDGLIPAIAQQHDTGEVLMMAWMTRESVQETVETGRVCYWSRSRARLWRKGETSGHTQRLVELRVDCDGDTLLVLVDQTGVACHTGRRNCFFRALRDGELVTIADVEFEPGTHHDRSKADLEQNGMQDSTILYRAGPPFILVDEYTDKDKKWLPAKRYQTENRDVEVRRLRGSKMQTYQGLMDEFGAALQFFEGFGENWAALEECLCYMDEWLPAKTYIVEIVDGQRTLADEESEDFGTFLRLLNRVGDWWARPIVDNPPHDRPAIPFHAVIKVPPAEWDRFAARIAEFTDLEPTVMTSRHT